MPGSSVQASLKCSCFDANLFCTHLWKTKNLSLGSGWVGWTVICSWAPDADFFTTPHPSYFSSRDLKALNKPWSSLTPWVIFCFHFPRWGCCRIPCLEMTFGVGGQVRGSLGIQAPLPHHRVGWGAGIKVDLRRLVSACSFEVVYDWRDSAEESKLEKLKNKQNRKRCR